MLYIKLADGVSVESEEVAPGIAPTPEGNARTLALAVRYLRETIALSLF